MVKKNIENVLSNGITAIAGGRSGVVRIFGVTEETHGCQNPLTLQNRMLRFALYVVVTQEMTSDDSWSVDFNWSFDVVLCCFKPMHLN